MRELEEPQAVGYLFFKKPRVRTPCRHQLDPTANKHEGLKHPLRTTSLFRFSTLLRVGVVHAEWGAQSWKPSGYLRGHTTFRLSYDSLEDGRIAWISCHQALLQSLSDGWLHVLVGAPLGGQQWARAVILHVWVFADQSWNFQAEHRGFANLTTSARLAVVILCPPASLPNLETSGTGRGAVQPPWWSSRHPACAPWCSRVRRASVWWPIGTCCHPLSIWFWILATSLKYASMVTQTMAMVFEPNSHFFAIGSSRCCSRSQKTSSR